MKVFSISVVPFVKKHRVLAGILVVGFLLRITGIFWGTPFLGPFEGYYHPDEWVVVQGAVQFPQHVFDNLWLVYPTFFHYFLGILTFPLRLFFDDFGLPTPEAVGSTFYWVVTVIGRLCSVVAGMGAIVLTFLLAKDVLDQRRALLASAFLAFTVYHAANSAVATTDVLTSFFLVLFLYVLRRAFLTPEATSLFVISGIVLGLLVGTKYTGAIAVVAIAVLYGYTMVSHMRDHNNRARLAQGKFHKNLLLCGGVALVIFFLTTPGILLHFDAFTHSVEHVKNSLEVKSQPRSEPETWAQVFPKLGQGVGLPLAGLFLFGLVFPRKKNVYEWSFIGILVVFFVYFEARIIPRYIILVSPLIAMIAGNAAMGIYEAESKPLQVLGKSLIIFVAVYSFGHSAIGMSLRVNDTRTQAAQYLQDRFPDATTLGMAYSQKESDWKIHRWRNPRIDLVKFQDMDFLDYPDVVVVSSLVKLGRMKKALRSDRLSQNFVWDEPDIDQWWRSSPPSPQMFRLYHELFQSDHSRYRLVKTFKKPISVKLEFSSPEMNIYVRRAYGPHTERRSYYPNNPREYFQEEDLRGVRWQLRVEDGYQAELELPPDDLDRLRIGITKTNGGPPWAIQLNQWPVEIRKHEAYVLQFRARADAGRSIAVGVGQTSAPWQTIGLYEQVPLTEDWQAHALAFRAETDESQARVYFDAGASAVSVEIADVELRHQSDFILASANGEGRRSSSDNTLIEPDLPDKYYVDYRFNAMGCRGQDYLIPRAREGTRILLLGDSLVLGAGVHQKDTIASQLDRLLNHGLEDQAPASNFEVINCGIGGYGTSDSAKFYETYGVKYEPDIVLLVMAPDDDQPLIQETEREVLTRPDGYFMAWSGEQESLFNREAPDYSGSLKEVAHLQRLVEAKGGKIGVVMFRHTHHRGWGPLVQQLTEALQGKAVPVLDLGIALLEKYSEEELIVHAGDKHPNERAHRLAAQSIHDFLRQ